VTEKLHGKVHKYGADVNTDVIIPARYLNVWEPAPLAKHCMEDIDEEFRARVRPGDMVVATSNFGCGSSREHAPIALKACGVSCVIAHDFARIFFRNAINIGLPALECPEAVDSCEAGDELEVDLASGTITNLTRGITCTAKPYPEFMMGIINAGGLVEYTRARLQKESA
jgi:3-isopropylmalate/(R)-2-methylmalate dehydratase small subunit